MGLKQMNDKIVDRVNAFLDSESDNKKISWREWFKTVFIDLCENGERFDGKRPMGYSSWQLSLMDSLDEHKISIQDIAKLLFTKEA